MSLWRIETCGDCRKFPLQRSLKTEGRAMCPDYEQMHHWTDPANPCVLFMPLRDRREKAQLELVEKLRADLETKKK